MENQRNSPDMIDLMVCPGFCVKDNQVIRVNDAAGRLFLTLGTEITALLVTGREEYAAFSGGCLCLTLCLAGENHGATVTRIGDLDIFLVEDESELRELRVLALAAQELRTPLSNIMVSADRLQPAEDDEKALQHLCHLNRGTSQLLRLIGNMSDALRYTEGGKLQTRNVSALLRETFDKAQALVESKHITLTYSEPEDDVYMLAQGEQLERAIYNILSNALKFTPEGGTIQASLTQSGHMLRLTVRDSGSGISEGVLQSIFSRYLRRPSLEDSRFGLGLGMVLIRAAARNHGGTVLIDQPDTGTRVTMTLAIRRSQDALLRSPALEVDYAGERDHGLLELSEALPADLYRPD